MTWRPIVSYILRGCQSVFAIIILGLTSGILAKLGHNESRVTYSLVVAIMNIIYFGYSLALVPSIKRNRTISSLIFICEALFTIFYLAAMGAIADVFPSGDCDSFFLVTILLLLVKCTKLYFHSICSTGCCLLLPLHCLLDFHISHRLDRMVLLIPLH